MTASGSYGGLKLLESYAPLSLESCEVGLTFEFMDSMNQEIQVGKEVRADQTKWLSPHIAKC
jgi:hypothetical protein